MQNQFAPSWYEQNYPTLVGTGTLLANQQRYLTEPSQFPVNPANARARALQDSLAAFFTAIPQQQQMAADRAKREQDQQLFEMQMQQYQAQAAQAKVMNPMRERELRLANNAQALANQQAEARLQIGKDWQGTVESFFPEDKALQAAFKDLPATIGLDAAINVLSDMHMQSITQDKMLSEEEAKRLNVPLGTVRTFNGQLQTPDKSLLDWRRRKAGGSMDEVIVSDPEKLIAEGVPENKADKVVLIKGFDKEGNVTRRLQNLPKETLEMRRDALMEGAYTGETDIASPEYFREWMRRYGTPIEKEVTNPTTGAVVQVNTYNPSPAGLPEPTHAEFTKLYPEGFTRDEKRKVIFEGGPTKQWRQKTTDSITTMEDALKELEFYEKMIDEAEMMVSTGGIQVLPKTGTWPVEASGSVMFIQDQIKEMLNYGAPQEAELKRLAQYLADMGTISVERLAKSKLDERAFAKAQIKTIRRNMNRYLESRRNELAKGVPTYTRSRTKETVPTAKSSTPKVGGRDEFESSIPQ